MREREVAHLYESEPGTSTISARSGEQRSRESAQELKELLLAGNEDGYPA
jgi:hypothetical protein